jgi:cysteine desulfurase / selenocysteine lyase
MSGLDVEKIRKDFPILKIKSNGKPLAYLDSTATSQKPKQVIAAIVDYYENYNANIHRGVYKISELATTAFIESKKKVVKYIGAASMEEIIYVKNTTEAINLVALGWGSANVKKGDHILITEMEHHSNIVPWQMLAKRNGAVLDYVKLDKDYDLAKESLKAQLEKRPKLVAFTGASNVVGTVTDAREITKMAKKAGATVLIDGAQVVPHLEVDVSKIGCDFFAFSAHKMLGPAGIGVLYGREDLLLKMEPVIGGGDMIKTVELQTSTWNDLPWKFEAGTPNMEGAIGLGAAINYIDEIGLSKIRNHEIDLTRYALDQLSEVDGVKVYGPGVEKLDKRLGVISLSVKGVHAHDVATLLDREGVAVRAGHHCAMPLVKGVLGEGSLSRISIYLYNTEGEIDRAVEAIKNVKKVFGK